MLTFFFFALIMIGVILYKSFSWGFVGFKIYNWFIIPIFTGAPVLSWVYIAGIMFFVNCFTSSNTISYIKEEYRDNTSGISASIFAPWLMLLSAWVFKTFLY